MGVVDFLGNNKPKFVNTAKTGEGGMPVPKRVCIVGSGRWCALFCYIWIRFGVVFTARCYASVVLAMGLCLCLSVTSRSSTKTAKRRITQTIPHDSPGTLVF